MTRTHPHANFGQTLIANERRRQVQVEGWTPEHDDNSNGTLPWAAWCYRFHPVNKWLAVPTMWPWALAWWKPRSRVENLVRAGALYQAEMDRLNRAGWSTGTVVQRMKLLGLEASRDECAHLINTAVKRGSA